MKVIVDGIIFQIQSYGGISRIYREILPRICDMDDFLHISLLTEGQIKQELPKHPQIKRCVIPILGRYLRPWQIWKFIIPQIREFMIKLKTGNSRIKIWHSTFYTKLDRWNGLSVVTVYDMIHERFPDFFNQQSENQFREKKKDCILSSDAVICISNATRQDLQNFYGMDSSKIWVVPLAHSDIFRQLTDTDYLCLEKIKKPYLLYVGDRVYYKNFEEVIQSYSIWHGRKDMDICVVGKPWSPYEEKCLWELGITDQVHLFKYIGDEDLCRLYNHASAFIYPSLYEGFGIPILEAMACGCPVIASRIPSTLEVAGDCPYYFDPGETDSLLNAFDSALFESRDSDRVQIGLEKVKDFSWNRTAAQTLKVYKAISGH